MLITAKKFVLLRTRNGNAFLPWALNNYSVVYIIDPRHVNGLYGFGGGEFKIDEFYRYTEFDDLVIINYPASVESQGSDMRSACFSGGILEMCTNGFI